MTVLIPTQETVGCHLDSFIRYSPELAIVFSSHSPTGENLARMEIGMQSETGPPRRSRDTFV